MQHMENVSVRLQGNNENLVVCMHFSEIVFSFPFFSPRVFKHELAYYPSQQRVLSSL